MLVRKLYCVYHLITSLPGAFVIPIGQSVQCLQVL